MHKHRPGWFLTPSWFGIWKIVWSIIFLRVWHLRKQLSDFDFVTQLTILDKLRNSNYDIEGLWLTVREWQGQHSQILPCKSLGPSQWEVPVYYCIDSDLMVMSMTVVMMAVVPIAKAVEGTSSARFRSYVDGISPWGHRWIFLRPEAAVSHLRCCAKGTALPFDPLIIN